MLSRNGSVAFKNGKYYNLNSNFPCNFCLSVQLLLMNFVRDVQLSTVEAATLEIIAKVHNMILND